MRDISPESMRIEPMRDEHVEPCASLWAAQFEAARGTVHALPGKWATDQTAIRAFLKNHAEAGRGVVAEAGGDVAGYMSYDRFPFHGADTAFCPIAGHASVESERARIYQIMYRHLSDLWVRGAVLDHIVTFFSRDTQLKEALFNLGFGLYVVDAFRSADPIDSDAGVSVRKASLGDIEDVMRLGEESRSYYREPPLFLVKEGKERRYYEGLLRNSEAAVFVAEFDGNRVGLMSVRKNGGDDIITLTDEGTGMIDELGAYIQSTHRGCGVGACLLSNVVEWCRGHGIGRIHVDYESANLHASGFWPKHFTPTMYSVRRRVNPDIIHY